MKTHSAVFLPWREEDMEEGEYSPLTSILSRGGERKMELGDLYEALQNDSFSL